MVMFNFIYFFKIKKIKERFLISIVWKYIDWQVAKSNRAQWYWSYRGAISCVVQAMICGRSLSFHIWRQSRRTPDQMQKNFSVRWNNWKYI